MKLKLAIVLLTGSLIACGRDDITPPGDEFGLILAITPPSRSVAVGDSADFTLLISVRSAEQASIPIVCTSSDASVAITIALTTGCRARAVKSGQSVITASKGVSSAAASLVVTAASSNIR